MQNPARAGGRALPCSRSYCRIPERAHSAILLEAYLPREAQAGVEANVDAYMRAMALYQAGDKLAAAQGYMGDVCVHNVKRSAPAGAFRRGR